MKHKLFIFFCGFAICNTVLNAQSLDEAILGAAAKISRDLPADATAAVIHFCSSSEALNNYVLNELYGAIYRNRKIAPVQPDQKQFQTIRSTLGATGKPDMESAQSIAQLLEVQYLVTGSLEKTGAEYNITFNAVDADAELTSNYQAVLNQNDEQLVFLLTGKHARPVTGKHARPAFSPKKMLLANVRDNWISVSGGLGFMTPSYIIFINSNVSYERMFISKISLGVNLGVIFGGALRENIETDVLFHFYPSGKTFFVGTAMGYIGNFVIMNGLAIKPEIGWKIDVGKEGGFFIQTGIKMPNYFMWYKDAYYAYKKDVGLVVYFGMGFAF